VRHLAYVQHRSIDLPRRGLRITRNQGKGNTGHLLDELMMMRGGFRMIEVPYRGSGPAINDLLAGNIDMIPDYLLANKQSVDAGKLKLLATAGYERLKDYPGVPTLSEIWPGVYSTTWMAVAAPTGTPKEITRKISDAIAKGFRQPDVQKRIPTALAEPLGSTPEEMHKMIQESLNLGAGGQGRQDPDRQLTHLSPTMRSRRHRLRARIDENADGKASEKPIAAAAANLSGPGSTTCRRR